MNLNSVFTLIACLVLLFLSLDLYLSYRRDKRVLSKLFMSVSFLFWFFAAVCAFFLQLIGINEYSFIVTINRLLLNRLIIIFSVLGNSFLLFFVGDIIFGRTNRLIVFLLIVNVFAGFLFLMSQLSAVDVNGVYETRISGYNIVILCSYLLVNLIPAYLFCNMGSKIKKHRNRFLISGAAFFVMGVSIAFDLSGFLSSVSNAIWRVGEVIGLSLFYASYKIKR